MDPLAHTLVGASLARTRLGRRSVYATPTAILGANAPDVDAVTMLIDRDLSLGFRRGWTHGVLAVAVLPLLLAGLVWVADRAIARARGRSPRARMAERQVAGWLAERDAAFVDVMAGPIPARPLARDVVVADGDHYHFLEVDWLRADPIQVSAAAIDRGPRAPIVDAALAHAPGTRRWLRFPAFTVEPIAGGHRVTIRDVRYSRRRGVDFPNVVVELDHGLRRIPQ